MKIWRSVLDLFFGRANALFPSLGILISDRIPELVEERESVVVVRVRRPIRDFVVKHLVLSGHVHEGGDDLEQHVLRQERRRSRKAEVNEVLERRGGVRVSSMGQARLLSLHACLLEALIE